MKVTFYHSGGRIHDRDNPDATTPIEPSGWYFWTETWADYEGPYESEAHAEQAASDYGESL